MKHPGLTPRGRNATSSVNQGPDHPHGEKFRAAHERIFGERKPVPGYTVIRYVNGKRIETRNCEIKSRKEVGLAPLKVETI